MKKSIRRMLQKLKLLSILISGKLNIGSSSYTVISSRNNSLVEAAIKNNYEPWADIIFSIIHEIKTGAFIDVGANVGQTLLKVLGVDDKWQYVGFEPQISACHTIDQFIKCNKLSNHIILPLGLSGNDGLVSLGVRCENDITASMIDDYRPEGFYESFQYIPVKKGDTILKELDVREVSLIKVDVEGGELDVLQGLQHTLVKKRPYIIFEVLPNYLFATKTELDDNTINYRNIRHKEMYELLLSNNYVTYQVRPGEGVVRINELVADKKILFNYIGVPEEENDEFEKSIAMKNLF